MFVKKTTMCVFLVTILVLFSASFVLAQEKEEKGPLSIKIGQGELTFWAYMHLWYGYFESDDTVESGDWVYPANEPSGFDIRRVRLFLDGKLTPDISYRVHYEVAGTSSNRLKDAFVKFNLPFSKKNTMALTVGQWKIPFSELTLKWWTPSDEFIRGTMILEPTGGAGQLLDRDLGIMFDSKFWEKRLYGAIGIFNGTEYNQKDDNNKQDLFAHMTLAPFAQNAKAGTLEFGLSTKLGTEGQEGSMYDRTLYAGRIKYLKAFESGNQLMLRTEYISKKMDGKDVMDVFELDEVKVTDWYFAAAYKISGKYEFVARYDLYDNSDLDTFYGERTGLTLGFNWYAYKNIRLMTNVSIYDEDMNSFDNNEGLVQLEFRF